MIEFEAVSPSCKLIGLLFQDSQDNAPHPLEDQKKSATLEASKDFIFFKCRRCSIQRATMQNVISSLLYIVIDVQLMKRELELAICEWEYTVLCENNESQHK